MSSQYGESNSNSPEGAVKSQSKQTQQGQVSLQTDTMGLGLRRVFFTEVELVASVDKTIGTVDDVNSERRVLRFRRRGYFSRQVQHQQTENRKDLYATCVKKTVVTFFRQPALAQGEQVAYFRSSQYTEMLGKSHLCLGKKFTKPYTNFWGL